MSKDFTKPFFCGENKDDIEGFLFDYKRYVKSKSWNEETQCGMIVMHMLEETKPWVRELIKTKNKWVDLMNAESNDVVKINRVRNIKQGESEIARGYASRFEAYLDPVKNSVRAYEKRNWFLDRLREPYRSKVETFCPDNYTKVKDCALQIESF
ncbi:hypothetical protein C2G38_1067107 [Gigaspora rosea]|uniref:Retrotransposon gag domain-containing protein n=1 Tax=Gigaspora rosea TaxID=44941 RepID=A0A397VPA2_9GLOM|nr:hypothetical protein C2G38_1067107 [Gigaspora rosea]